MTTFEHGKAPAWACATWRTARSGTVFIVSGKKVELYMDCDSHDEGEMNDVCRALSLAKLAEDWGKAERNLAELDHKLFDPFVEFPESKAACAVVNAARAALLKACAE